MASAAESSRYMSRWYCRAMYPARVAVGLSAVRRRAGQGGGVNGLGSERGT